MIRPPSPPSVYRVRPSRSRRGRHGSFRSPSIRHSASMTPASTSCSERSSTFRLPGGTKRSIHGSRFSKLLSNVERPANERVGSVKTQSSS
eukprot:1075952-Prymnesium_polylepis.1